jgi:hypothetical protein
LSIGRTNSKESSFCDDDVETLRILQERRRKKRKKGRKSWEDIVMWRKYSGGEKRKVRQQYKEENEQAQKK